MRQVMVIIGCLAAGVLALLAACKPATVSDTGSCTECHSGDTDLGNKVLAAKAQYEYSGHFAGPRVLEPAGSAEIFIAEGSNAMYCNGGDPGGCSKCHTDQGFVASLANGGVNINVPAASQPGCFTCHAPHETGNFTVRTQVSVLLVDGTTTFNKGKGNLCVICHQARTKASAGVTATNNSAISGFASLISGSPYSITPSTSAPKVLQRWSSSSGPHHGPQADFLMGTNFWKDPALLPTDFIGAGQHYTNLMAPDGCATCHMYEPETGRLGGNLSMGGHGKYLNGAVHGSLVELVSQCKTCHVSGGVGDPWPSAVTATTFDSSDHTVGDIDGDGSTDDILVEIEHLKKKLLTYFGESSNFLSITYALDGSKSYTGYSIAAASDGQAPVTNLGGLDYVPGTVLGDEQGWHRDWEFNGYSPPSVDYGLTTVLAYPVLTKWQSESFWNFKFFMEDRSAGVHNPTFAAQILYDAIKHLNDNGTAIGLGVRP
jgi:hypothetical protein